MKKKIGFKPQPLSLKILFVILILWVIGSIFALPQRYELGLPFFGMSVYGILAAAIVLILDIIAPIVFLYALWKRESWGPQFALVYMGIFILNSIVALFTHRVELGFMSILIPSIITLIFLGVIYSNKKYFN